MRNPVLILCLVASAITTASAVNPTRSQGRLLSPTAQARAGSFNTRIPRQDTPRLPSRPGDDTRRIDREREQTERERNKAGLQGNPPTGSEGSRFSGNGENGGVSSSAPAVGANADQGGNSESSPDGDPEDGVDVDKIIEKVSFAGSSPYSDSKAPSSDAGSQAYSFRPQQPVYQSRKRETLGHPARKRADEIPDIISGDGSGDENSGQDGADGQSIKGSESNGGVSGNPGSSEGGHVYNYPEPDNDGADEDQD